MIQILVFALCTAIFLYITVFCFLSVSKNNFNFFEKFQNKLKISSFAAEAVLIIISVLDLTEIIDTGGYKNLSVWCAVFCAVGLILSAAYKKMPEKFCTFLRFFTRSVLVCTAAELFIFNCNSAHLFGKDYNIMVLETQKASGNFQTVGDGAMLDYGSYLEFKGINMPVGTITFKTADNIKGIKKISIDMSDDTNNDYRYGIANAQIIASDERSYTVPCNFSGNVHDLRFSPSDENSGVVIKEITLNIPIFLKFSFLRFFIMLSALLAVYLLTISPLFKKSLSQNKLASRIGAYSMTAVFILAALLLTNAYRYSDPNHSLKRDFQMNEGNQMTQEIVDAFEAGQVSLLRQAEDDLLSLENPYDWSQRNAAGVSYAWDHLLYEGKYYSYYGIAPVVALFLPYHMATDHYFPSVWAVWLFGTLGIFFLSKFYMAFMFRFFPKIRSSLILAGLFIMQLSTGIWFCFSNPNFYEIAQTSGFACVTAGAFFLISSNIIGEGKIKNWRIALSTVFLSLGVLCRPTLAIYCIAALIFIFAGFKKKKSAYSNGISKVKHYLPYFLCAIVPFVVIGGAQMIYNYARFGSIFDFGIQYSLTINDFTSAEYHTHFVLIGFFNYLLAFPTFSQTFPFFTCSEVPTFNPQGYYFVATASALGLLWRALPVFSYGWGIKAYRWSHNKDKKLYSVLLASVCLAAPAVIIASIWESGYGTRYSVDFAWQILIGALVIAFIIFSRCSQNIQKHLCRATTVSAGVSLILNFGQVYNWILNGTLSDEWREATVSFGRLAEFWR